MSGITDPSEEYFKDGLWAWVADQWKKLTADASSFLQVNIAAQDIDVEVKQQAAADLTPGVMGWDGAVWRKLAMLWGYSDRWIEATDTTASGAGNATTLTTIVPEGYVYVLEGINAYHDAGVAKDLQVYLYGDSTVFDIHPRASRASGLIYTWFGRITLKYPDRLGIIAYAPGDGKKAYITLWGHMVKVAE